MTTTAPSTALVMIQPAFTDAERLALAGFPAGYRGLTREAYRWTCASSPPGAAPAPWPCSRSAEPASSRSPGSWRPGAGPAAAWTGTLPTSPPPTSQALHGKGIPAGRRSA